MKSADQFQTRVPLRHQMMKRRPCQVESDQRAFGPSLSMSFRLFCARRLCLRERERNEGGKKVHGSRVCTLILKHV